MNLNVAQLAILKSLWRTEVFKALESLAREMCLNWARQGNSKQSEWEFIRDSLDRDGKIQGVEAFLKQLEQLAAER